MKLVSIAFFVLLSTSICVAQNPNTIEADSLYKEDQFYAGVTYNLLDKKPEDITQSGFSLGFHLGFIKDMPVNKKRNLAIGLGLGYSANSFNQNLLINADTNGFGYTILEDGSTYSKNKFSNHTLEIPLEFRWRTSTETNYNFWRIYAGFKFGYVFTSKTNYKGDLGSLKYKNIEDFNNFQYGLTLSVGYNTWNLHFYYALNPIFSSNVNLNANQIDMKIVKIGLMFYIL